MKKLLVILFLTFLVLGVLAQISLVHAEDDSNNSGKSNAEDRDSSDANTTVTISADDSEDDNETDSDTETDKEDTDKDETEIEIEIEREGNKVKIKAKGINATQLREALRDRNKLRIHANGSVGNLPDNCSQTGAAIKCNVEGGRIMTILAGESGNTIIQSRDVNASTQVQLYHHNGEVYGLLEDNETKLIDLLPDQVRDRVKERIKARIENETIELGDDGNYEVRARKQARFLGLFKVRERIQLEVDSESGNVLSEKAPWWGFLANDVEASSE